ncbi:MAG: hypothetical protein NC081_10320 [Roseburia sp.]|nr:hypothetical protein [Roseburia sp.]
MKKASTKVTVIIILLIIVVVGYYAYLSNRKQVLREESNISEVEKTLSRDMTLDYPSTPKEVLKYYNEILNCFYNEECTDEEIEKLGSKARELYDDELLENNDPDTYMIQLKSEIQDYKDKKRHITNMTVSASTNVERYTVEGNVFARLGCGYTIKEDSTDRYSNIVYLLRRDENKKWKIYGWDLTENVRTAEKTEE